MQSLTDHSSSEREKRNRFACMQGLGSVTCQILEGDEKTRLVSSKDVEENPVSQMITEHTTAGAERDKMNEEDRDTTDNTKGSADQKTWGRQGRR
jgi:hypothetical protein